MSWFNILRTIVSNTDRVPFKAQLILIPGQSRSGHVYSTRTSKGLPNRGHAHLGNDRTAE